MLYYQTDVLGFSKVFIGTLGALGNVGGILGAVWFFVSLHAVPLSRLLYISIALGVVSTLCFIGLVGAKSAIILFFVSGILTQITHLAVLDLAARSCPPRAEGTIFALLMSTLNISKSWWEHSRRLVVRSHRTRSVDRDECRVYRAVLVLVPSLQDRQNSPKKLLINVAQPLTAASAGIDARASEQRNMDKIRLLSPIYGGVVRPAIDRQGALAVGKTAISSPRGVNKYPQQPLKRPNRASTGSEHERKILNPK